MKIGLLSDTHSFLDENILEYFNEVDEIWASELHDWLISLGIPSDYILLASGSQDADEITLVVGDRAELKL